MSRAECLQASARGFKLGVAASLLFDQIILDSAHALGGLKNALPVGYAFSEQYLVMLIGLRRPLLTMDGPNAAGVGSDPGHRVGTGFQASSDIQLEYHRRFRVFRQKVHRALAHGSRELGLMIVVPGRQA